MGTERAAFKQEHTLSATRQIGPDERQLREALLHRRRAVTHLRQEDTRFCKPLWQRFDDARHHLEPVIPGG